MVGDLPQISALPADAEPKRVVRLAYRSFDRQWTFEDPRLANLERPSLWRSRSASQVFLSTMTTSPIAAGPALTASVSVPDKHHSRGSYGGKDVIPLFRDAAAREPNVTAGLLDLLGARLARAVTPEDLVAYCYALLAHPGYQVRFAAELAAPGPRVPLTADPTAFAEAVAMGRALLDLHTYGERYADSAPAMPSTTEIGWRTAVTALPETMADIGYESATETLVVGAGRIARVIPEVWGFTVSGFPVLPRWLGSRTAKGVGRATTRPTPLDLIRPAVWLDDWNDELLDLVRVLHVSVAFQPRQEQLLERILAGPLVAADELPAPSAAERAVPRTT